MDEEPQLSDVPAVRWDWMTVPLATAALGSNVFDSIAGFFGTIAFAMGSHIKYRRLDLAMNGPILRSE